MKINSNIDLNEIDLMLIKSAVAELSNLNKTQAGLTNFYCTLFYEDFNRKINLCFMGDKCYRCGVEALHKEDENE